MSMHMKLNLNAGELLRSPKAIMTVVVLAATGWALTRVMYPPAHVRNQQLREQTQVEGQRRALITELHHLQAEHDRLLQSLPPAVPDWLIKTALANATAAGLQVSDISPSVPQAMPSFHLKRDAVRLSATAPTYHQVGRFISICEHQQELIRVDAVQVTGGADSGQDALKVSVTLTTFYPAGPL